ncbi:hypothetical protein DV736_g5525, partial [Chaetothyriales sp. CBS 134916]
MLGPEVAREQLRLLQQDYHDFNPPIVPTLPFPRAVTFAKQVSKGLPCVFSAPGLPCPNESDYPFKALAWTADDLTSLVAAPVEVAITPTGRADAIVSISDYLSDSDERVFLQPATSELTLPDLLQLLNLPRSRAASSPVYYLQSQNSNLTSTSLAPLMQDLPDNFSFAKDVLGEPDARNIWIGNDKSVTSLHRDPYENLYLVLKGSKTFKLWPPVDESAMPTKLVRTGSYQYDASACPPFHINLDQEAKKIPWIDLDPLEPEHERILLANGAKMRIVTVHEAINYWYDMDYEGERHAMRQMVSRLTDIANESHPDGAEVNRKVLNGSVDLVFFETAATTATNGTHSLPFKLNDPDLLKQDSYVHDQWVQAKSGKRFDVIDPGSDKVWASCPDNGVEDVDAAVQSSYRAFKEYSILNPRKRAQLLLKWHELITAAKDDLAKILTHENGKPLAESIGELDYSLGFTWWFAGEAERIQGSIAVPSAPNRRTFIIKQPIGVAVALVPWNFPIAMILRKAGAAFAAGCTMVVKPSPETPLTCLALAHLATKAGFAPGVFNVLTTSLENTPPLSEALCVHPLVKKVTFTGSTRVGKLVAGLCAKNLKKCTLELGGNCPFIVFDDADLEEAATQFTALKWRNAGQACVSANRLYVQSGAYDEFTRLLVEKTSKLKVGHGAAEGTTMGPVTTPRGLEKAEQQAADAVKHGAKLVLGTGKAHAKAKADEGSGLGKGVGGYFMDPTILTGMTQDMLMSREETFAPVAGIFKFEKEEEAVKWANDTSMGLASYAFTKNVDRLWRMLENLEAGMIGLNTGNSSAAESPFGGIKESGYGKESGKDVAVREYLIEKTGTFTISGQY